MQAMSSVPALCVLVMSSSTIPFNQLTIQPFMHLVQRIAELQEDNDGMEKLKGEQEHSQPSSCCKKLAGQTTPQAKVLMLCIVRIYVYVCT